jgi:hypothetical protein
MKYKMFSRVSLKTSLPRHGLRRGDVATIVEHHPGRPGQEPGYTLEVFNAVGETVDVVTVRESQIEPLTAKGVLHVRPLAHTVRGQYESEPGPRRLRRGNLTGLEVPDPVTGLTGWKTS